MSGHTQVKSSVDEQSFRWLHPFRKAERFPPGCPLRSPFPIHGVSDRGDCEWSKCVSLTQRLAYFQGDQFSYVRAISGTHARAAASRLETTISSVKDDRALGYRDYFLPSAPGPILRPFCVTVGLPQRFQYVVDLPAVSDVHGIFRIICLTGGIFCMNSSAAGCRNFMYLTLDWGWLAQWSTSTGTTFYDWWALFRSGVCLWAPWHWLWS